MSSFHSYNDTLAEFRSAMLAEIGTAPDHIHADGTIHRFRTEQDKRGQRSGWYVLHLDRKPTGVFGDWKRQHKAKWRPEGQTSLTASERADIQRQIRALQEQREREQKEAQERAATEVRALWRSAKPAAPSHSYLQAKQISPAQVRQSGDVLLVPLTDGNRLVNVQRIYPDGAKRFYQGGRVSGCWCPIEGDTGPVYVCEGWATGVTINRLTGKLVACAMNAGNLSLVAKAMRERYPSRHIIIAGDNDRFTEGNPGKTAAIAAAQLVSCEWMVPDFPGCLPGTDYNDRYLLELEGKL